jgi:peroxiredoxin
MRFVLILLLLSAVTHGFGQPAARIVLTPIEGDEIHLQAIARKGPTLLTFCALWCGPCKQELRALQTLHEQYASKGFTVIAINQDSPKSSAKVRSYVSAQAFTFPVVLDLNGQLLQQFNGQALPYSVLLDSTATVVYTSIGYLPGDESKIEEKLLSMLVRK